MSDYSEDALIEQPTIALFAELGWETLNCYHEFDRGISVLGRETRGEVVLRPRLRAALERLNPELPSEAIDAAMEELTRGRAAMIPVAANREIYRMLKNGVRVRLLDRTHGGERFETVQVIDWRNPDRNNFLLASQLWVSGEMYNRRADLVGFVNGLPLLFMELKAVHRRLKDAYDHNLSDYRETIPQLFWYNAVILLSNGSESRIGSMTASWEHFAEWKKIASEEEPGTISLETIVRGTCTPAHLLDITENFLLFMDGQGGTVKVVAKNHQYLGVNNAIGALTGSGRRDGKLGVFWHTQGSGKSISMIFFSQKVLRTVPGNWTFLIVTDRQELDRQIYRNFASAGAVTEEEAQATSAAHLRQLLTEDHRHVFTLIQKFRTEDGEVHPELSTRRDIIVITDEAHRSQYDRLALNMRTAIPNALFIAFTGTPLIAGEELTRDVFGDYVSVYNFRQSVEDRATVPIYYENRIPELQLTNHELNTDMERLLEEVELDHEEERKLEREFAREYHLITRNERLETIASDIVSHFMGRGFQGKGMVVCIDKATAVRLYDKVRYYWDEEIRHLERAIRRATDVKREMLEERLQFMQEIDMAVIVSQSQNEIAEMRKKGLDIAPHRRRMNTEDMETKFKDPEDTLRLVFVCAMWLTGFDAPSCSTIYLDKPMRNHTLMQTIARANRVFGDKVNGLIVDYVGVFRSLRRALAIYGSGRSGDMEEDLPASSKKQLVQRLREALAEGERFCSGRGIHLAMIEGATGYDRIRLLDDAVEAILMNDESKRHFMAITSAIRELFAAILPDTSANELAPRCNLFSVIVAKIRNLTPEVDISGIMTQVEDLLDRSVAAQGYLIKAPSAEYNVGGRIDLSAIDFEKLRQRFQHGRKHTEVARLRDAIERKLARMVEQNRTRIDFLERFKRMIDEYNAGSTNIDELFGQIIAFIDTLNQEERRGLGEQLSEEELAVYDLLTKPDGDLTKEEEVAVKAGVRQLLSTLRREKLVLDWKKSQQARAGVRITIDELLDKALPKRYTAELYKEKCVVVYQHVYDSYYGAGGSLYS